MALVFGIGIENETIFTHFDSGKKKFNNTTAGYDTGLSWSRERGINDYGGSVDLSSDGTVFDAGMEIQTSTDVALNVKPKKIIQDLVDAENDIVIKTKNNSNPRLYPLRMKNPYGAGIDLSKPDMGRDGAGSIHLNLSMPYDSTKIREAEYKRVWQNKLFRGVKSVRWIQPLLVAMTGGSGFKSVGSPTYAEGTERQAYDSYSNIGNVSLNDGFLDSIRRTDIDSSSRGQRLYKYGNRHPLFREKLSLTTGGFVDSNVGDIDVKRYPNIDRNAKTIEFRFLDNFRTQDIYPVLKVICSALENGEKIDGTIEDGKLDNDWNEATRLIIEEGWNAQLPKSYIEKLNQNLGLNLRVSGDSLRADLVMEQVQKQLWDKNKEGLWVKTLFDERTAPKLNNLQKDNWDAQFRARYFKSGEESFKKYIDKVLTTLKSVDASNSSGWINVWFGKANQFGVRDIMLDDESFGIDIAAEDFEDILHLLFRMGLIEKKEDTSGKIIKIKVLYQNVEEFQKKLEALPFVSDTYPTGIDEPQSIFGEGIVTRPITREPEIVAPEIRRRVREPVVTPAIPLPTTRPVLAGRESGISIGTTNIDATLLSIRRISGISEDADSDRGFMEEVFSMANFTTPNGQRIEVSIVFAEVKYGTTEKIAFWKKTAPNRVIIYLGQVFINISESEDMAVAPLMRWLNLMASGFYSSNSVTNTNIFVEGMTKETFFGILKNIIENNYAKGRFRSGIIKLDRAGIRKLEEKGVYILSFRRGQEYRIASRDTIEKIRHQYPEALHRLKNIPYYQDIYVQQQGNIFRLMKGNQIIDKIEV